MQKINSKILVEIVKSSSQVFDYDVENIVTDSRKVQTGDLFIAIKGENFDAHDFVVQVIKQGAALVIVSHLVAEVPTNRQIVVDDTLQAYGLIGAYNRSRFKGKVIGLTGSAGKTTTKEELKFALSLFGKTYATEGNHNNQMGVPITLCDLDMEADFAIIEMGMSSKGEISQLVSYVKPDMALITNVYPMHIEFFENFEGIARAKAEIFEGLASGSYAVINADTNFAELLEKLAKEKDVKVEKFGKNEPHNYQLELSEEGEHHLYNAWAVLKVVELLGLDVAKAAAALKDFGALPGRGMRHQLKLPNGGVYTLIDDSYSGQPEAMKLGIETLGKMQNKGRKVVVLGKMAELGDTSRDKHLEIGKAVENNAIDVVVGVCPEMKDMLSQISMSKMQYYFENKEGLDEFLINKLLQNNDIVLIKGARYSSKLYQVAESLIRQGAM